MKPLGWRVKKSVEIHEENKTMDPVFMAICRIKDIQTTSMNTLVRAGVLQLLPFTVGNIRGRA